MALQRLRDAAERAKIELSEGRQAAIHLPFLASGAEGKAALHLDRQLSREKLEELTQDLVDRAISVADRTMRDSGVRTSQIGEVLQVGGMTRMPRVQAAVKAFFGREPSRGVHPEEVVALGAAIQAHALLHPQKGKEVLLLDVTPQNLGTLVVGGYSATIIPRNTTVPTSPQEDGREPGQTGPDSGHLGHVLPGAAHAGAPRHQGHASGRPARADLH